MSEQEFTMLRKGQRSTQNKQDMRSWISPVAAIYGDNAAGKSNLLKCMNFFSNFVRSSSVPREGINTQPFLLDRKSAEQPSTFYIEFIATDRNRYQYWFSIDAHKVLEEVLWMFRPETNRRTVVFERESGKETKIGAQFHNIRKFPPCSGERTSSFGCSRAGYCECDACIRHYCKRYSVLSCHRFLIVLSGFLCTESARIQAGHCCCRN